MRAAAGDELRHSFSFADGTGIRLGTSQRLVPIEELSANDHIVPGGYRERILKRLDHFRDINNVYRRNAAYLTNIPATGELAYLNTIFMAVPQSVRQALELDLGVPISLQRFYAELNGLFLLQTIHVFGFRPSAGYLLSREPFEGMAYPLAPATPAPDSGNARIVFGSYWFDGSQLLVDVETGEVFCYVGREQSQLRARWPSFDDWLDSELDRLIPMFDAEGNTDVPLEQRLPGPERD